MIVVDTSALIAVVLNEPSAEALSAVLEREQRVLLSAGTLAEALIVAGRRGVVMGMTKLIEGLKIEVVPVSGASARRVAAAYDRWGKGIHPTGLNFGDCFAYELADREGCPLLYAGNDFRRTDLTNAVDQPQA